MISKKIVITGAAGFLGRNLIKLQKDNEKYQIYALTSRPDELRDLIGGNNVKYLYKNYIFQDGRALNGAIVVNCAFPRSSTGIEMADGLKYIQRIFEASADNNATAIINISSQSVYSPQRTEAATEESEICLDSPYAVGKYSIELMLESIVRGKDIQHTSLRMASLIGPEFDQRIVNRLIKTALTDRAINVDDDDQIFGFMDIEDAVNAIKSIIDSEYKSWRKVYNVGVNKAYSLKQIASEINNIIQEQEMRGITINIHQGNKKFCSAVNCDKFNTQFKYQPNIPICESILKIYRNLKR